MTESRTYMSEGEVTANELADKLDTVRIGLTLMAATMLRQQAKEIAMLKQIIDANNLQSDIGQLDTRSYLIGRYYGLRELTDEEILETVKNHFIGAIKLGIVLTNENVLNFARAILKKASDK